MAKSLALVIVVAKNLFTGAPRQTILSVMQSTCDTRSFAANTYLLARALEIDK